MEDIGRSSDLMQDRKRPMPKHIWLLKIDGLFVVRGIACRCYIAEARYC
jgi:hypothetical protein